MPFIKIKTPEHQQIFQRSEQNKAIIPINLFGLFVNGAKIKIQYDDHNWVDLSGVFIKSHYHSTIELKVGWYELKFKLIRNSEEIEIKQSIQIGVGEVFITAGQSNSANSGNEKLTPKYNHIYAWNKKRWEFAMDPQPITNGTGGTPWPPFADAIFEHLNMPIGLISVGVGGTAVKRWLPNSNDLYPRLANAMKHVGSNGARAILWHQGESDVGDGTSTETYRQGMEKIIDATRNDGNWNIPWLIAIVSFHPDYTETEKRSAVANAQKELANYPEVYQGPTTDDMIGPEWRYDRVHFNKIGLIEHGKRWAERVIDIFFTK